MTKYQWNLTSLFSDDNDPNIELEKQSLQKVATEFVEKWEGRNDWLENAESLRQILEDYNDWLTNWGVYGKVGYYLLSEDQEKIISLFSFHKGKWVDMVEEFLSSQTVEWQEKLPENVSQK